MAMANLVLASPALAAAMGAGMSSEWAAKEQGVVLGALVALAALGPAVTSGAAVLDLARGLGVALAPARVGPCFRERGLVMRAPNLP